MNFVVNKKNFSRVLRVTLNNGLYTIDNILGSDEA